MPFQSCWRNHLNSMCFSPVIVAGLLCTPLAFAQVNRQELYFVSGSPAPYSSDRYPAQLHWLDKTKAALRFVRLIAPAADIWDADYDRRIVVAVTDSTPIVLGIVHMDLPGITDSLELPYPRRSLIRSDLLELTGGRLMQCAYLSEESNKRAKPSDPPDWASWLLVGVDLLPAQSPARKPEILNWEAYQYVRRGGMEWRGGNGILKTEIHQDGTLTLRKANHRIQLPYRAPAGVSPQESLVNLVVNNDSMLVLKRSRVGVKNPAGVGFSVLEVLDKKAGAWHSVRVPGSGSWPRGFGPWIVATAHELDSRLESPGKAQRRQLPAATGRPADWDFRMRKIYSPGILFLHNALTRKEYTIDTKQGDSEVLLVEGDVVYYRVNRSIYKATIGQSQIENPVLVVAGDLVPDVHWAFLGPPIG